MVRLLLFSLDAALVGDPARRVRHGGHDVKNYIEAGRDRGIADGSVPEEHGASIPDHRGFDSFGAGIGHGPRDLPYDPPRCTERRTEPAA